MLTMQANEGATLETLVIESVHQHEEMIGVLEGLHNRLAAQATDTIQKFNTTFSALQTKTQQTDLQLTEQLSRSDISDTIRQLLVRRKFLQGQILQLLKESLLRAGNVKSLLASEMQTLKTGRRALNGYRNVSGHQGRIINSTR